MKSITLLLACFHHSYVTFFVFCNCNLYILFIYPFIYTGEVQNSMVNQSLQFLEYICFTVDYSLHLIHTGMLNKKNLAFLRTPLPRTILGLYVPSQVYKDALKIAESIYKPFLQLQTKQLPIVSRNWSLKPSQTPSRSLKTHVRGVNHGRAYRSHLLTEHCQDVWIKATERIIWMMFNFGNGPTSKSKSVFCYYRGDLSK